MPSAIIRKNRFLVQVLLHFLPRKSKFASSQIFQCCVFMSNAGITVSAGVTCEDSVIIFLFGIYIFMEIVGQLNLER